ncbi:hypothetical protein [Halobacterium sp. CBA1126]|uniref:hypothetical protein n=1 Tax=Halobacterium sp. CBA1126 TaxID=2668074 RepID=UPI0012FCFC48|nr:hypothetical protein [Halobacterium sp. CBA1126]MUV59801.1 hypothetical protein [Halobacterium sp. CBA1126]
MTNSDTTTGSDGSHGTTEHTVIEAECLEDNCDELESVTHLEHARTDRQTELVLDAHVQAARLHEEEAGHEFNVSVDTGTPSEMEALYEDLTGERLVADGGTEQETAAILQYSAASDAVTGDSA